MSGYASVAAILEQIPSGLVRRASDHVEKPVFLETGIQALDRALGGWIQGRLNVLRAHGSASTGRTTIATATVASVTASGYPAAWIDGDGSMDPVTLSRAGANLEKILWVKGPLPTDRTMKAADLVISSGIFSIVVIRPSGDGSQNGGSTRWMRLSRTAAASGTTVLILEGGGVAIPDAASVSEFGPMQPRWTGTWGYGFLDGATIGVETGFSDASAPECVFSTETFLEGFTP